MISQAILHIAIRFGIAFTAFQAVVLTISRFAHINPFGQIRSVPLYLLPLFIFFGLRYLRRFEVASVLSYSNALRQGSMITIFGAACSAMLLYIYAVLSGPEMLAMHIAEMQQMVAENQKMLDDMLGQARVQDAAKQLELITPASLAYEDFFMKLVLGMIVSLLLAFFFKTKRSHTTNQTDHYGNESGNHSA